LEPLYLSYLVGLLNILCIALHIRDADVILLYKSTFTHLRSYWHTVTPQARTYIPGLSCYHFTILQLCWILRRTTCAILLFTETLSDNIWKR